MSIAEYLPPDADSFTIPDGLAIVVLSGELDIAAVPLIREAFTDAIGRASAGVIADLSRVSFIDSRGFRALVDATNAARHLPGGLAFTGIPDHMNRLLRLAGLSDAFPRRPSFNQAERPSNPAEPSSPPSLESPSMERMPMISIPSPREPLAPEVRPTRNGIIWSETDKDVTAVIVLRQIPCAQVVVSQSTAPHR